MGRLRTHAATVRNSWPLSLKRAQGGNEHRRSCCRCLRNGWCVKPLPRSQPTALGAHRGARERLLRDVHSMGKGWGPLGCTNIFCIEPDEVDTTYFYILVTVSFINCLVALQHAQSRRFAVPQLGS